MQMMKKPVEQITVKEISDIAGYNRSTFYLYYSDVYDLERQTENELLEKIDEMIKSCITSGCLNIKLLIRSVLDMEQIRFDTGYALLGKYGPPEFAQRLKQLLLPVLMPFFVNEDILYSDEGNALSEFYMSGILGVVRWWIQSRNVPIEQLICTLIPKITNNGGLIL